MYYTSLYTRVFTMGTKGIVGLGSNQSTIDNLDEWALYVYILSEWTSPDSKDNIVARVHAQFPETSIAKIRNAVNELILSNHVTRYIPINPEDRYSRNWIYYTYLGIDPTVAQARLSKSCVAILGCGGIGNHIATSLATAGVGSLSLIDDDEVELSNLTRQIIFDMRDVSNLKTSALKDGILRRNSEVTVETHNLKIIPSTDLSFLDQYDLIVLSADTSDVLYSVNSHCVGHMIPYIAVGYLNDIALIGPLRVTNEDACIRCTNVTGSMTDVPQQVANWVDKINQRFRPATFPTANGVASYYALNDIIKVLCGHGNASLARNKRIGIYSNELKIEVQPMKKSADCKVCGTPS